MDVTDVTGRLLTEGDFEDGVIVVGHNIVALVNKYFIVVFVEIMHIGVNNLLGILTCSLVELKIIGSASHLAIGVTIGGEIPTTGCHGQTGNHSIGSLTRDTLNTLAERRRVFHAVCDCLDIFNTLVEYLDAVGHG